MKSIPFVLKQSATSNMKRLWALNKFIGIAAVTLFGLGGFAAANTYTISTTDSEILPYYSPNQGWYSSVYPRMASSSNYSIGSGNGAEFRNFFSFQLPTFSSGEAVSSVSLQLTRYNQTATVSYSLFDVSTDATTLKNGGDLAENTAAFNDLGTGISYGTFTVLTGTPTDILTFDFNADGIAAVNAASGQYFSVGGALSGADLAAQNVLFASSNDRVGQQLVVTTETVPEPATWALMVGGLGAMFAFRRWR